MRELLQYVTYAIFIGVAATAFMDLAMLTRRRLFGVSAPDYTLVGRWLAHSVRGRLRHAAIATSPRVAGERVVGWTAHYAIGIAFAGMLLAVWGLDWTRRPTVGPALIVGIGSIVAPFFIMQPAMGAGIASSRTPDPAAARRRSLVTHSIFGAGLYVAGVLSATLSKLC